MPGRPKFEPSEKQRGMVQALAAAGYGQDDIAAYLGISDRTLRKAFRRELDFAEMELIAGAVNSLGRMAVGAPAQFDEKGNQLRAEVRPELGACCFILKTRGKALGWTERLELTGKNGAPIELDGATSKLAALIARRTERRREITGPVEARPA